MADQKENEKRNAAIAAIDYVQDGMTLGLGTGSTAKYFIDALGEKITEGWSISGIPTSEETERLARAAGIDIIIPDETTIIDVAVDGADEASPDLTLIKGGGAALLREKIIAKAARQFIVIADKSKRVATLGAFPLPVEVENFGWALTVSAIRNTLNALGFKEYALELRVRASTPVITDGGNLVIDCALGTIPDPTALELALQRLPGVVECGLFCGLADLAIFGDGDSVQTVSI